MEDNKRPAEESRHTPAPLPEIHLDAVDDNEKESFLEFLVENEVEVGVSHIYSCVSERAELSQVREGKAGEFIAEVDLVREECNEKSLQGTVGVVLESGPSESPPSDQVNLSGFTTFVSLIGSRRHTIPKQKVLAWLTRTIEELYDARFEMIPTVEGEDDSLFDRPHHEVPPFPVFIYETLGKLYGLKHLVDQTCMDLLYNTQLLRSSNIHVETFGLFLEEVFDENDMLFYLYVRSVLQTELMRSIHAKQSPVEASISWKQVNLVARTIFGRLSEDLYQQCVRTVDKYMLVDEEGEQYVEAINFLYVALVQYHDTRKRGVNLRTRGSSVEWDQQSEAATTVSSFANVEKQQPSATAKGSDRVVDAEPIQDSYDIASSIGLLDAELDSTFAETAEATNSATSQPYELAVDDNERLTEGSPEKERTRAEPALRGLEGRVDDHDNAEVQEKRLSDATFDAEEEITVPTTPPPPPPPPSPPKTVTLHAEKKPSELTPTEQILLVLKRKLQEARQKYLDTVLEPGRLLPGSVQAELFDKVNSQLEHKVRAIISDIAGAQRSHTHSERCTAVPDACIYLLLQKKFRDILKSCRETGYVDILIESQIQDYAKTVINSNEVREAVEPLVALLVTYAKAKSDLDLPERGHA